jgi:hypothetical protein
VDDVTNKKTLLITSICFSTLLGTSCKSLFQNQNITKSTKNFSRENASYRADATSYNKCSEFIDTEDLTIKEYNLKFALKQACLKILPNLNNISEEGVVYPYLSELSESLTPQLEAYFDAFLVINTDESVAGLSPTYLAKVPKQHVRVVVKKKRNTKDPADNVFIRDLSGNIIGIDDKKIDKSVPELERLNQVPSDLKHYTHLGVHYLVPSTTGSENFMKTVNALIPGALSKFLIPLAVCLNIPSSST